MFDTPPSEQSSVTTTIIAVASVLGASGLAALLKVWVENRRLTKKDYRMSLLERIEQLEKTQLELHARIEGLAGENGRLKAEVAFFRGRDHDRQPPSAGA